MSQEKKDTDKKPAVAGPGAPVYKPPLRGAPGGRVGGGTRGTAREVFVLSVLAPDHSGLTASEQPSLYWFISNPTSLPIELTLMDPQGVKPILETQLPSPTKAGIQRVRLADYNVRLAPGAAYRWFVAVVPDADRRSKDILAGGAIERVDLQEDVKTKLAKASDKELPFVYAQAYEAHAWPQAHPQHLPGALRSSTYSSENRKCLDAATEAHSWHNGTIPQ